MKPQIDLFSFDGRISRRTYWLLIVPLIIAVNLLAVAPIWIVELMGGMASAEMSYSFMIAVAAAHLILFAGLWPILAVGSKRLHDRNKRGWWLLVWWVLPLVLLFGGFGAAFTSRSGDFSVGSSLMIASLPFALWGMIELGMLPGTEGPNQYGADPAATASG
jgi:uncharacterized membrane protein YhaH (DUF805 family)